MSNVTITYPTEPGPWTDRDRERPFRCDRCRKMCTDGDGKWVSRGIGPGHFVAVHRKCPRWWKP